MALDAVPSRVQDRVAEEESEGDDDEGDGLEWNVGFAELPRRPSDLYRHRFPSKVGGAPAWLQPVDLPHPELLTCPLTHRPLDFLAQVYAPLDQVHAGAFHRSIFLFVSPQGDQLSRPGRVRALRCQLARENPFYPYAPPSEADLEPPSLTEEQQLVADARDAWSPNHVSSLKPTLFPEYELLVEPAEVDGYESDGSGSAEEAEAVASNQETVKDALEKVDKRTAKLLKEYKAREAVEGAYPAEELLAAEASLKEQGGLTAERRHLATFCTEISKHPEQCLRYCFSASAAPLCPSLVPPPPAPADVPPCPNCGAPRQFEFQVLPQILHYLDLDNEDPAAPDFACIAVYSCSASCSPSDNGTAYQDEFVWVQPPMNE